MGHIVDARLADFARRTGIEPATGEWAETLERIQQIAFDLIRIVELERSGVRDGDGRWHGCDPLGARLHDLAIISDTIMAPYWEKATKLVLAADEDRPDWMREYDDDRARQQAHKLMLVAADAGDEDLPFDG